MESKPHVFSKTNERIRDALSNRSLWNNETGSDVMQLVFQQIMVNQHKCDRLSYYLHPWCLSETGVPLHIPLTLINTPHCNPLSSLHLPLPCHSSPSGPNLLVALISHFHTFSFILLTLASLVAKKTLRWTHFHTWSRALWKT